MQISWFKTLIKRFSIFTALLVFSPGLWVEAAVKPETVMKHRPPKFFKSGYRIQLAASIKDPQQVLLSRCYFRYGSQAEYLYMPLQEIGKNTYQVLLPAPAASVTTIEYLFLAVNGMQTVVKSTPHTIAVSNAAKTPDWLVSADTAPQLTVFTELPVPPTDTPEFDDNLSYDVAESSARFGSVVGLYAGTQSAATTGGGAAASSTATSSAATSSAAASSAAGASTAGTTAAVAGGTVATGTAVSTTTIIAATAVTAAAAGGAVAVASSSESSENGISGNTSSATAEDFVGTWRGTMTSDAGDPPSTRTMVISGTESNLTGTVSSDGRTDTFQGPVSNGVWNITSATTDSTDPDCADFGSTGTGTLNSAGDALDISLYGLFCRPTPNTMTGTFYRQ